MASRTLPLPRPVSPEDRVDEPGARTLLAAAAIATAFVVLTRWPVARARPLESDEFGFLQDVAVRWLPMHHTLFKALARAIGLVAGDAYRGFIVLDMMTSALALVGLWWWLRALVPPATAAAAALMLGVAPNFWGYGAVAANYTAIVLVGSVLLGIAIRGHRRPERWHPFAAATILAAGTGYRPDLGVLWLPVLLVILWQHRWRRALLAGLAFGLLNLAWAGAMIAEVGGWGHYRAESARFAHSAGAMNSVWHLGLVDGPVRYALKLGMALAWTLGPALVFVPRGLARLRREEPGPFLAAILALSVAPALAFHLLIHFGVAGYSFHYLPALVALVVLGIGPARRPADGRGVVRLLGLSAVLAAAFWFYPANFSAPGWRGDFDLAFCRLTRNGLNQPAPRPGPSAWRTANSPKAGATRGSGGT